MIIASYSYTLHVFSFDMQGPKKPISQEIFGTWLAKLAGAWKGAIWSWGYLKTPSIIGSDLELPTRFRSADLSMTFYHGTCN